jgi:hypothetical protein
MYGLAAERRAGVRVVQARTRLAGDVYREPRLDAAEAIWD